MLNNIGVWGNAQGYGFLKGEVWNSKRARLVLTPCLPTFIQLELKYPM